MQLVEICVEIIEWSEVYVAAFKWSWQFIYLSRKASKKWCSYNSMPWPWCRQKYVSTVCCGKNSIVWCRNISKPSCRLKSIVLVEISMISRIVYSVSQRHTSTFPFVDPVSVSTIEVALIFAQFSWNFHHNPIRPRRKAWRFFIFWYLPHRPDQGRKGVP